jgi:hypothetical protein
MMRRDFIKGMIQQHSFGDIMAALKIARNLSINGSEKF